MLLRVFRTFKEYDIFHHSSSYVIQKTLGNKLHLSDGNIFEFRILHQRMNECLRLTVSHAWLGKEHVFHGFFRGSRAQRTIHDQIQRTEIFLDLSHMRRRNLDGKLFLFLNIENILHAS